MTKRGSDDLSMDEVNGSAPQTPPPSLNNTTDDTSKKAKLTHNNNNNNNSTNNNNNNNVVSRVVHLRNVPIEANETDLCQLSVPFGRVTNVLLLRGKSQGFIEFESALHAQQMIHFWTQTTVSGVPTQLQPTLRGRHVFLQLSNHKELRTQQTNNDHHHHHQHPLSDATNCVLRVVIENLLYPVTLELLHSVFARAGKVLKMVTFTKNGSFQALVQYDCTASAVAAKTLLDGQSLFSCACTLRIDFSKLTALNVRYNNEKSRDFTNPSLPANGDTFPSEQSLALALSPFASPFTRIPLLPQMAPSSVLLVSNLNAESITTDSLFTLFGVYGDVIRVKILFNKKDNALIQMAEPAHAHLALTYLDKVRVFGRVIRVAHSKHATVALPKEGHHDAGLTKDFSSSPLHRFKKKGSKNYANIYPPSATLHLSNIPQSVQEEDIRSAFARETQLTIVAFKFFPKDRKMALVQMTSIDDAITALIIMHNHQLSESSHLRVSFSKSAL